MEWVLYLLKVSVCSAVFFSFYLLFLKRLTFFRLNRFYLLATLALSFLIPGLPLNAGLLPLNTGSQAIYPADGSIFNTGIFQPEETQTEAKPLVTGVNKLARKRSGWPALLLMGYVFIAFCRLVLFGIRLGQLLRQGSMHTETFNGLRLVHKASGFTNCSFFNYVFINKNDLPGADLKVLLRHEEIHAGQYHSADKIILALCKILLWFNPVIYFYDKALEQVHEYEADETISSRYGARNYANLLLRLAAADNNMPLIHHFIKSPVKERIKMLFNSKSTNMKKLVYLLCLPLGLGLAGLLGADVVEAQTAGGEQGKSIVLTSLRQRDTLRLVGQNVLGENPKVTIDGKGYDPEILTRISPRCIQSTSMSKDFIEITTKKGEIEYATPTDIENARVKQEAEKSDAFYLRYRLKRENGEFYDMVRIKSYGSSGTVDVSPEGKVLILVNGKKYSEEEAKNLPEDIAGGASSLSASSLSKDNPDRAEFLRKYGEDYEAVIQVPAETNDLPAGTKPKGGGS